MLLSDAVARYVVERTAGRELNGRTPYNVRATLSLFVRHLDDPAVGDVSAVDVESWKASMPGCQASTVASRLGTLRSFARWVRASGLGDDFCAGVKSPRRPRGVVRSLLADDVAQLLAVAPDARARLIVLLMVQEGLRRAEVASLEVADLDLMAHAMVVTGKGGHQRILWLTEQVAGAVREYLAVDGVRAGPLIRSRVNPHLGVSPDRIGTLLREWLNAAGVKSRPRDGVSAHALRHTMATDMVEAGVPLPTVQAALGHASLATTGIYTRARASALKAMEGRWYGRDAEPALVPV